MKVLISCIEMQIEELENELLEYIDVNNSREKHLVGISQVLITILRNQLVDYKNCRELTKKQTFQNLQLNSEIKEVEQKN